MLARMSNGARLGFSVCYDAAVAKLMIVAGEPSGDAHAAMLVEALQRKTNSAFEIFGATGPLMRAAGVESIINTDELAILGILEVTRSLPKFVAVFRKLKQIGRAHV